MYFLWIAFIASPTLVSAKSSNSASFSISVLVPERLENQRCAVGFENNIDDSFTELQSNGCRYNSKKLLQTAYQQASSSNNQGFVTVIVTAP